MQIRVKATGKTFTGQVIRFTRELNTSTRTMLAEVDVPNPDLSLTSGMYAETTIILQHKGNTLTIPAGAVVRQGVSSYVLVVDSQNKVVKVPVVVGIQGASRVEISKGLSENQSVIVSGQSNYEVGQIVHPKPFTISMPDQEEDQ
jgi:multidrug efflux pump subunit AcrA (membrane-fusion protein)